MKLFEESKNKNAYLPLAESKTFLIYILIGFKMVTLGEIRLYRLPMIFIL